MSLSDNKNKTNRKIGSGIRQSHEKKFDHCASVFIGRLDLARIFTSQRNIN